MEKQSRLNRIRFGLSSLEEQQAEGLVHDGGGHCGERTLLHGDEPHFPRFGLVKSVEDGANRERQFL